jgi:hypothetical protein
LQYSGYLFISRLSSNKGRHAFNWQILIPSGKAIPFSSFSLEFPANKKALGAGHIRYSPTCYYTPSGKLNLSSERFAKNPTSVASPHFSPTDKSGVIF